MTNVPETESDYVLLRKFFAIQDTITYCVALKRYSDSKLQAAQIADSATFTRWLNEARAWRAQTNLSYQ
jgi:hypothetical protein